MDLQAWDNIISITSNSVTALSIFGGVIFGGSKIKNFLETKKHDTAFRTAISLYDEFDNLRSKYLKIKIKLNHVINDMDESLAKQHPITAHRYFEIQSLGIDCLEDSVSISRLLIKAHNFNTLFNEELFDKIRQINDTTNQISNKLDDFFNLSLNSLKNKIVESHEIDNAHIICEEYEELFEKCNYLCSEIRTVKFKDFCNFT